ncbi:MAG: phosphatase PAP2 family protein [Pasteurellaceae bacterium]|nr:phosphatase PAP2 family protein [Pasteurellaceae bacterium]
MFKRFLLYTLLLCLVPLFAWIFNYHWQGDANLGAFDHFLYFLTETGSTPYALITCVIFGCLCYGLIRQPKQWGLAVAVMIASMVVTQGIKTGLKIVYAEPRPYIVAMADTQDNPSQAIDYFYHQDRKQRALLIQQFYANIDTPNWLILHRTHETGYSFPSGHAMFSASWLFLVVGFSQLYRNRKTTGRVLTVVIGIWAILLLISRLRLGMHYPIDVFTSCLIALPIHWAIFTFLQKKGWFKA